MDVAVPGRDQFPTSGRAQRTTTATAASAPTLRRRRRRRRCRLTRTRPAITEAGRLVRGLVRAHDRGPGLEPGLARPGATEAGTLGQGVEAEVEAGAGVEHLEDVENISV